jgi:hypothetical protein
MLLMCTFATTPWCCSPRSCRPPLPLAREDVTLLPGSSGYIVIVIHGLESLTFEREMKHTQECLLTRTRGRIT